MFRECFAMFSVRGAAIRCHCFDSWRVWAHRRWTHLVAGPDSHRMRKAPTWFEFCWVTLILASVGACRGPQPGQPAIESPGPAAQPASTAASLLDSPAYRQWELPQIAGVWRARSIKQDAAVIDLLIAPRTFAMDDDALERWVHEAASGVARYYGTFPVPRTLVVVVGADSGLNGITRGEQGASVLLQLGADLTEGKARSGWILTHELLHVTFPSLDRRRYAWVGEGLSSYLEPIVRVRAGTLTVDDLWRDLLRDAAQGLPESNDQGLDHTPTWGRTYWGGALFWLEADLTIREQTGGRHSLDDALRAIARNGGTVTATWTIEHLLETGDKATETHVLSELHRLRGQTPAALELDLLWRRLGVRLGGERVVFDDAAPWAELRVGLTVQ